LSTIWVVALCMLTQDCNLSEEYRVEWPFYMFSKTTEITYQSSKYPPATSSSGDAHATNRGVPPSCDCWETGRGDSDCEVFDCTCICDLTAGECDHNCCCDKECNEAQRQRFDAIQACLPEGAQNGEITRRGSASTDRVESLCGGPQVLFNKGCGSGQPKISSIDARHRARFCRPNALRSI
jgi:hypothetical protein